MATHKSAEKRARQAERRRLRNVAQRSRLKTAIKKLKAAPKETAISKLPETISLIDRLAVKGIIHKNKAANLKSKLMRLILK